MVGGGGGRYFFSKIIKYDVTPSFLHLSTQLFIRILKKKKKKTKKKKKKKKKTKKQKKNIFCDAYIVAK